MPIKLQILKTVIAGYAPVTAGDRKRMQGKETRIPG